MQYAFPGALIIIAYNERGTLPYGSNISNTATEYRGIDVCVIFIHLVMTYIISRKPAMLSNALYTRVKRPSFKHILSNTFKHFAPLNTFQYLWSSRKKKTYGLIRGLSLELKQKYGLPEQKF